MACLIEMLLGIHRQKFPTDKVTRFEAASYYQRHPDRGISRGLFGSYYTRYEAYVELENLEQFDFRYLNATMKNNDEITIGPIPRQDGFCVEVIGHIRSIKKFMEFEATGRGACALHFDVRHVVSTEA